MPNDPAPIPVINCSRLVGLELELDAGNTEFRRPGNVEGWFEKHDGSLMNGREYVLEPALPFNGDAKVKVKLFCDAANAARMNVCSTGGFHVHVQSQEFDVVRCTRLAKIYSHFQDDIDRLVAPSRHNNRYCSKFGAVLESYIERTFSLSSPASSRIEAKLSRSTTVVNFATCRVRDASQRSIEFRQGSSSKQFGCVWGWTAFVVALVEIASTDVYDSVYSHCSLVDLLRRFEANTGSTGVADWVVWRDLYMNRMPTEAEVSSVVSVCDTTPRGIFHITREADMQIPLALKALNEASSRGLIVKRGSKWVSTAVVVDRQELVELENLWNLRNPAAASTATPV